MRNRRGPRGAVLLATLFLVLVISMFVGAASHVGLRSLVTQGATSHSAQAEAAAESGVQYALFRLRQNSNWRGDGNGIVVDTPELIVREDHGNVVGYLGDGQQFRLRFNYQDGAGAEGLEDPEMLIDHPYVSVNNIMSGRPSQVPRADGPGSSVTESSPRPYRVPEFTVCLIVEGRASSTLLRGDFSERRSSGRVATSVVEGFYRVDNISELTLDAAAMAGRDFDVELPEGSGQVLVETRDGHGRARVRSKGRVAVDGGDRLNYLSPSGQVLSGNGRLHARAGGLVDADREGARSPFYDLEWDQVRQADPATSGKLAAGTYVWWNDGTLHHYDLDYDDYVKFIKRDPSAPGGSPVFPSGVEMNSESRTLVVNQDIEVVPGNSKELNIIPRSGAPEGPPIIDPTAVTTPSQMSSFFQSQPELFARFLLYQNGGSPEGSILLSDGSSFHFRSADNLETFVYSVGGPQAVFGLDDPIDALMLNGPNVLDSATTFLASNELGESGAIELPGVQDDLTPDDLGLNFSPGAGKSAVLSVPGNVRIGTQLKGYGGSIVSQGSIRVIGFGTDFSANPDAESGVSMYAKQNIAFSTYVRRKGQQGAFQDVKIKGVMYAWGDIKANLGNKKINRWGRFDLEGAMVAYGGIPGSIENPGVPGSGRGGRISLTVSENRLIFDPAYLLSVVTHGPQNLPMRRTLWKRY